MNRGYIKFWRKAQDCSSWNRGLMYQGLIINLLCRAAWKRSNYQGKMLLPGQIGIVMSQLAASLSVARSTLQRMVAHLEADGFLRTENSGNRFTVITIANWHAYQCREISEWLTDGQPSVNQITESGQPPVNQRATDGQPSYKEEERKKEKKNKNTTTQGSTVNEGRARARVDVPEGGDGLCPERHEAEEWSGDRVEPEAPDVLDGTLDVSMEFIELRDLFDRCARREAPLAGHDAYKMLRAGRMWPGLARITQAIAEWGETPRWKRGYAPGLKRFLSERWWLRSPDVDEVQAAASDAGREPDTYSRLLEEARKQKEVRA